MDGHVAHTVGHQAMAHPTAWPWVVMLLALASLYIAAHLCQPAGKRWPTWRATS